MTVIVTKYGRSPLSLTYKDNELENLVSDFTDVCHGTFTFSELCSYVLERAMREKKLNAEPYTRYTNIVMTEKDEHRLTMMLWQMIWDRRIVIEFRNNDLRRSNETLFGVVKKS